MMMVMKGDDGDGKEKIVMIVMENDEDGIDEKRK